MEFTDNELKEMQTNPEALRVLANYHEVQATMADAIGDFKECVTFHEARKAELLAEADRIDLEWING